MYNPISQQPPDQFVTVVDVHGRTAFAVPTIYNFKVVPNRLKVGKWTGDIVFCDPYWDGGWLIESDFSGAKGIDEIIGWMI